MKENGWVCETFEEFKQYYKCPQKFIEKHDEQWVDEWLRYEWDTNHDKLVVMGNTVFPYADKRYLQFRSYCVEHIGDNHFSYVFSGNFNMTDDDKKSLVEQINSLPDEIYELLQDIGDYYDFNREFVEGTYEIPQLARN